MSFLLNKGLELGVVWIRVLKGVQVGCTEVAHG